MNAEDPNLNLPNPYQHQRNNHQTTLAVNHHSHHNSETPYWVSNHNWPYKAQKEKRDRVVDNVSNLMQNIFPVLNSMPIFSGKQPKVAENVFNSIPAQSLRCTSSPRCRKRLNSPRYPFYFWLSNINLNQLKVYINWRRLPFLLLSNTNNPFTHQWDTTRKGFLSTHRA